MIIRTVDVVELEKSLLGKKNKAIRKGKNMIYDIITVTMLISGRTLTVDRLTKIPGTTSLNCPEVAKNGS